MSTKIPKSQKKLLGLLSKKSFINTLAKITSPYYWQLRQCEKKRQRTWRIES